MRVPLTANAMRRLVLGAAARRLLSPLVAAPLNEPLPWTPAKGDGEDLDAYDARLRRLAHARANPAPKLTNDEQGRSGRNRNLADTGVLFRDIGCAIARFPA